MNRRTLIWWLAALSVTFVVLFMVRASATAPQTPAPSGDSTAQLLDEVRRLREAIEALAGNGARVQIVFGRLQLQEQRTVAAARRLDDLRGSLARVTREVTMLSNILKDVETKLTDGRRTAEEQDNLQSELTHTKRAVEGLEAERQRLALQESEAALALGTEQARWAELNSQLDELERSLAPRRQ